MSRTHRIVLALVVVTAALGLAVTLIGHPGAASAAAPRSAAAASSTAPTTTATTTAGAPATSLPKIRHVFIVILENEGAQSTFPASGPAPAPYLADTMRAAGAFLPNYFGTGHFSNDNYIAMISGQAPNPSTSGDCTTFSDFPVAASTGAPYDQQLGAGCVYPSSIKTIADQLTAAGLSWKAYAQDMGNLPAREPATCAHPAIGSQDKTQSAVAGDGYAARHNPFVYFHSIIDDTAACASHVVNLDQLPGDLRSAASTPAYSFIIPDLCQDGHDETCATPGESGGYKGINDFLSRWVPAITASPAYTQENGLLFTTFDEAATSDTSACCGEIAGPNDPEPGITGPGGGRTGAVLLSPCIAPGTVSDVNYNHYSMLGSFENLFGLTRLGYANLPGESYFGSDVFTRPTCAADSGSLPGAGAGPGPGTPSVPAVSLVARAPRLRATGSGATIELDFRSVARGATYALEVRRIRGAVAEPWRRLLGPGASSSRFRYAAVAGATYGFRVQATDRAGRRSTWTGTEVTVPTLARPAGVTLTGTWSRVTVPGGLRHAGLSGGPGEGYRFTYTGRGLAILGLRGPGGGLVRVSFDGRSQVISAHAAHRLAQTAVYIHSAGVGRHTLSVRVLSGHLVIEALRVRDLA